MYVPLYIKTGSDRPGLKYLNRHVIKPIASKWYDIGLELMEVEDENELDTIQDEPSLKDNVERAKRMFKHWLKRKPDATWNDLLKSLKISAIGLNTTALDIERLLLPEGTCMFLVMVNIVFTWLNATP